MTRHVDHDVAGKPVKSDGEVVKHPAGKRRSSRRRKLIEPRLQLKFVAVFLVTAGLLVLVQTIVVSFLVTRMARSLPHDGPMVEEQMASILRQSFLLSLVLLTPISLTIGVLTTFKIVGPIYRFREYLTTLARGEQRAPCKIRRTDELQDFCALLNEATAPLRRDQDPVGVRPADETVPLAGAR